MSKPVPGTKYILLVGDGMGDYPRQELAGKTPLQAAETPNMDRIASCRVGLVRTVPEGMEAGSDVANLCLLGYAPRSYHTGRAPLEAASMAVNLAADQIAFRMNLVTLAWTPEDEITMVSHSAGDISSEEGGRIAGALKEALKTPDTWIYPGVAYRHLLVWEKGPETVHTIPPHDVLDENMALYLNSFDDPVVKFIRRSWDVLADHPVNLQRRERGLKEANSIWLWGQGRAPELPLFKDRFGLKGGVISAVDLLKGIGVYAGFDPIPVEGVTGYLNTNFLGKAEGAIKGLERFDFVFVHVEAPDEASHNGNLREKIEAIEAFDEKVVGIVLQGASRFEDYRIMVASDHLTPLSKRTHTGEFTPFAWASKGELARSGGKAGFDEESARKSGLLYKNGEDLMPDFLFGD